MRLRLKKRRRHAYLFCKANPQSSGSWYSHSSETIHWIGLTDEYFCASHRCTVGQSPMIGWRRSARLENRSLRISIEWRCHELLERCNYSYIAEQQSRILAIQADAHLSLFCRLIKSLQHTPCHFIRLGLGIRPRSIIRVSVAHPGERRRRFRL